MEQIEQMEQIELYEAPIITTYGDVLILTQGSGGNESDGCSSGKYENDPE